MSEDEKYNGMFYYDNMKYSNVTDENIINEVEIFKKILEPLKDDIIKGKGMIQIHSEIGKYSINCFSDELTYKINELLSRSK